MAKDFWFKFNTGDWLKDPALSMCEPATRGIWIDLLSAMRELDDYKITGTYAQLARISRCDIADIEKAIDDLAKNKAADVTKCHGNVTVMSRRFKREVTERVKARERQEKCRSKGNAGDTGNSEITLMSQECHNTELELELKLDNIVVINAREDDEFNESEKAKAVTSSESDLLMEWKVYFQNRGFTSVKYITDPNINRLCLMLVREGLTKPEVDAVIAETHEISKPHNVSTPLYYERPLIEFIEAKKNPKPLKAESGKQTTRGSNYAHNSGFSQDSRDKYLEQVNADDF